MTLMRLPDWDTRMRLAIDGSAYRPFAYGCWDCCLFAADIVEAMTGTDPAAELRGRYADVMEAMRIIRSYGGMAAMLDELLGTAPIKPALASRGDVVLLHPPKDGDIEQIGTCLGDAAIVASESGPRFRPMSHAIAAWRIG